MKFQKIAISSEISQLLLSIRLIYVKTNQIDTKTNQINLGLPQKCYFEVYLGLFSIYIDIVGYQSRLSDTIWWILAPNVAQRFPDPGFLENRLDQNRDISETTGTMIKIFGVYES